MKKIALLICILPSFASAAPVYLSCEFDDGESPTSFSVSIDEAARKVTHTWDSGNAFNADGFFSADTLTYQTISVSTVTVTQAFSIDRTNLKLTQSFKIEATDISMRAAVPGSTTLRTGQCELDAVPERLF